MFGRDVMPGLFSSAAQCFRILDLLPVLDMGPRCQQDRGAYSTTLTQVARSLDLAVIFRRQGVPIQIRIICDASKTSELFSGFIDH